MPDRALTYNCGGVPSLPTKPTWFHRLDDIRSQLEALRISHLDRLAVQKLFGVRERRARQIMAGLSGMQVGNAFAVEREALMDRLEKIAGSDGFRWEMARRARLTGDLERIRKELAARRVRISAPSGTGMAKDLGAGIELWPGEIRIHFQGAEDLAGRLFKLSQAMAEDWNAFRDMVEKGSSPPRQDQG